MFCVFLFSVSRETGIGVEVSQKNESSAFLRFPVTKSFLSHTVGDDHYLLVKLGLNSHHLQVYPKISKRVVKQEKRLVNFGKLYGWQTKKKSSPHPD